MTKKLFAACLVVLSLVCLCDIPAFAGKPGHFFPGTPRIRDFLMPDPGFYYIQYNTYYSANTLKDKNGKKVENISLPGGKSLQVSLKTDVFSITPMFIWVPDVDVLGGHYGMYIAPGLQSSNMKATTQTYRDSGRSLDYTALGFSDMLVEPVWLGWSLPYLDLAAGYGFYAPTGYYETHGKNNVGLGYWTHQVQSAAAFYPFKDKGTAIVAAVTYEASSPQFGTNVIPGPRMTLNYGVSQYIPFADNKWMLELAVAGYAQKQISHDYGKASANHDPLDQVFGLGPQVSLAYVPWNVQLSLQWKAEFGALDRVQGQVFNLNLAYKF